MSTLQEMYDRLLAHFGSQHWWPADSPFEVLVGAVLTQNTNWANVTKALDNLRAAKLLSFQALHALPAQDLAPLIRPSGYYILKAKRLKNLLQLIADEADGDLALFFEQPLAELRPKLLQVKGIGPETADSILLYGGNKAIFVVDAYTHRLLSRHGLVGEESSYDEMQELFHGEIAADQHIYNEYHALIVRLGKEFCRKRGPLCTACPLADLTPIYLEES